MNQLPVPMLIGTRTPAEWDQTESVQQQLGEHTTPAMRDLQRPSVAADDLDWDIMGVDPRWIRHYASDCVAALQPGIYSSGGAEEFTRFLEGAAGRNEAAVVVHLLGSVEHPDAVSVFGPAGDSLFLSDWDSFIRGVPLGPGAQVRPVTAALSADAQLALMLKNHNPSPSWHRLALEGVSGRYGELQRPAQGSLTPILETPAGEVVAGVWESPDGAERRYILPAGTPWPLVVSWLLEHALPQLVPDAMRRARRSVGEDLSLLTSRELSAHDATEALEKEYSTRKADLERERDAARMEADQVRHDLLYGTGAVLAGAVRQSLEAAGVTVDDLDDVLGGTKNADLLCTYDGRARLVEVKAHAKHAGERDYDDLVRHLREWGSMPGVAPVEGGVLVVNHQHRLPPRARAIAAFGRPEFLQAQEHPIVTAVELFDLWRNDDHDAVRRLFFPKSEDGSNHTTSQPEAAVTVSGTAQPEVSTHNRPADEPGGNALRHDAADSNEALGEKNDSASTWRKWLRGGR